MSRWSLMIITLMLILSINAHKDTASSRLMLSTPTYDGSGQAVHPDVFYSKFGWPNPAKYRYWMVLTPYERGDFMKENPSILVSNDGRNWFVPEGLSNPIEPPPAEGHYSDPDIVFGDGKLWVFFRWDEGLHERIYAKSSKDGIHWSEKFLVLETSSESLLSPSLVFERGIYKLWYIDIRPSPNILKLRTSTFATGPWSEPVICRVEGVPKERELWHLDVIRTKSGYDALFVLINKGKGLREAELYFGTSDDGVNWTILSTPVLVPSERDWDNSIIYRSTALLLEEREVRGVRFRNYAVWYSACNKNKEWHIGYTELSLCMADSGIFLCSNP